MKTLQALGGAQIYHHARLQAPTAPRRGYSRVVVAAQQAAKGIGRIRLTRVADASARSLEAAITAAIEVGSQVRT